jgi:tetratricopeptide (TPR) repeat protein
MAPSQGPRQRQAEGYNFRSGARTILGMSTLRNVDHEELLHLAIEASREQRHGDAIDYLKQAVERSGSNYKALYLLAAQHAQIGLTERAIEEFNQALAIEPNLPPARFQLGLLLLCNARVQEALEAWGPLEQLGENDPYLYFKRGMECLCRDDFTGCEQQLRRGMELNTANAALNGDMQRVLNDVAAHLAKHDLEKPVTGEQPGQILLNAYTKSLN